jgi:ribosomal protein L37AE/L43A
MGAPYIRNRILSFVIKKKQNQKMYKSSENKCPECKSHNSIVEGRGELICCSCAYVVRRHTQDPTFEVNMYSNSTNASASNPKRVSPYNHLWDDGDMGC